MAPKVLNVAEKPSVAKEVSRVLSNGSAQCVGGARFNRNWSFAYNVAGQTYNMLFTSVAGHLKEIDFADASVKKWRWDTLPALFDANLCSNVPSNLKEAEQNLKEQARDAALLVLWLDCDREGEAIAFEVIDVCKTTNWNIQIKRARFSALVPAELHRAMQNLDVPRERDAAAVAARQEIDLRIGAIFTRAQTLLLGDKFNWSVLPAHARPNDGQSQIISYGPCQFPTLYFIVARAWEIQAHVPEAFWTIRVLFAEKGQRCVFEWQRGRLYDKGVAAVLMEACVAEGTARVISVDGRERQHWPPFPLSTLELQKRATSALRMPGAEVMKVAEELYQAGFISYPRTETDRFSRETDIQGIIDVQSHNPEWGQYAQALLDPAQDLFMFPDRGQNDDKAHPPIHPTRAPTDAEHSGWPVTKKKLYELVARSFLAACSKPAVGFETTMRIDVANEVFTAKGLMVQRRAWLDVYPYSSWGAGPNWLPPLQPGSVFTPSEISLDESKTQPPPKLSERDLISLMERHGIGTDATTADHIKKQLDRGYATKDDGTMQFWPTKLGEALVHGYMTMGLDNMYLPGLRATIESNIDAIAGGRRTKQQVLAEAMQAFRLNFAQFDQQKHVLMSAVAKFFQGSENTNGHPGGAGNAVILGPCRSSPECGGQLCLHLPSPGHQGVVRCSAYPACSFHLTFPSSLQVRFIAGMCR
ncbi:unnamed protein product [Pedinophyceae sp. YPF-701]|nr:unnamed protein product [Pedinophyceae sp. YPF-701]